MSDRGNGPATAEPIVDRSERMTGIGRLIVLAGGLVGAAIAFALMRPEQAQPFVLGLLGLLAVVGVFTLFAGAIGLIGFAGQNRGNVITKTFVDLMGEGWC
jgi:two-component system cell cycle sensor histidine kinase/response regulator CckA